MLQQWRKITDSYIEPFTWFSNRSSKSEKFTDVGPKIQYIRYVIFLSYASTEKKSILIWKNQHSEDFCFIRFSIFITVFKIINKTCVLSFCSFFSPCWTSWFAGGDTFQTSNSNIDIQSIFSNFPSAFRTLLSSLRNE